MATIKHPSWWEIVRLYLSDIITAWRTAWTDLVSGPDPARDSGKIDEVGVDTRDDLRTTGITIPSIPERNTAPEPEKELVDEELCVALARRLQEALHFSETLLLHSDAYFTLRKVTDDQWNEFHPVGGLFVSGAQFSIGDAELVLHHYEVAGFWCVYTAEVYKRPLGCQEEIPVDEQDTHI